MSLLRISSQNFKANRSFMFSAILLRLLLEVSYWLFLNPVFAYSGFAIDFNFLKYLESWFIWGVLLAVFPKRLDKASDFLMVYFLFSYLTPLLIFYGLSNAVREHLFITLVGVSLIIVFRAGRFFNFPVVKQGRLIAYIIIGLGALFVTAWMFISGGIQYINFDIKRVYEFRAEVGSLLNQGLMSYINIWATKVFGPLLLAIALWKKKYFFVFMLFGIYFLWFSISSHRAVLFYPFLVTFLWFYFRSTKALVLIPLGMAALVLTSLLVFVTFDVPLLASLFIRRVFFVTSHLTFTYYEFFSQNPLVYWSESITSAFIKYPYPMSSSLVIGEYIGGKSSANNSFLSTGYMHAGVWGVILYGTLAGLIFRLIDSLANKGLPQWLAVASVLIPAQGLMNSTDLPTALLTHGLGIAILLLFLLRRSVNIKN